MMTIVGMQRFLCVCLFCVNLFSSWTYANCYLPNGKDVNAQFTEGDVYQPCDSGDEFGMCCALNRTVADKCRSDGLCLSTFDDNVWRDSCSDPYWKSPKCVKLCDHGIGQYTKGKDKDLADNHFTVTVCQDGSYCCGNGTLADSCCKNKRGVFVINGVTTDVNPSATSSQRSSKSLATSSTSKSASEETDVAAKETDVAVNASPPSTSSTSSASSTSIISPSITSKPSSSDHTGAIVGGIIGGVAIVVLAAGIFLLLKRQKLARRQEAPPSDFRNELDARQITELDGGRFHHEMQ